MEESPRKVRCELDHIAIVVPSLAIGADWSRRELGVLARPGGEHARMGTHNLLLGLGGRRYLEIIAINPQAPAPGRARWFAMDGSATRTSCGPITWVARTDDIDAAVAVCPQSPGEILPMSRGALNWRITVPVDGSLREGGVQPTLIQWDTDTHPGDLLPDDGLRLERLILRCADPARCRRLLDALGCEGPIDIQGCDGGVTPQVEVLIRTPQGTSRLRID